MDKNKIQITTDAELKFFKEENAQELFNLIDSNREYLCKFLQWPRSTNSVEDSLVFIKRTHENAKSDILIYGIFYQDKIAGVASYNFMDKTNKKTELGYWIGESFQKKGLITNAVNYLTKYAIEELKLNRVGINCATKNIPSQNIPKKLGFKLEGIIRSAEIVGDNVYDHFCFSMIREEYFANLDAK